MSLMHDITMGLADNRLMEIISRIQYMRKAHGGLSEMETCILDMASLRLALIS